MKLFKYYNGEEENPFPKDDVRSRFWWGEKMFVKQELSVDNWRKEGQMWLQESNEQIKQLASKYSPEQFGLITYISCLYGKWWPYDDPVWILEY